MRLIPLVLAILVLGCSEPSPTHPRADSDLLAPSLGGAGLLACAQLEADSVSQVIGPEGGELRVGPHTLSVPAGALAAPVLITAVAPADTVSRVALGPDGLTFEQPAALVMSYAHCGALAALVPKRIAYTTASLAILEFLPSVDDLAAHRVTGSLRHFSDYAVAW